MSLEETTTVAPVEAPAETTAAPQADKVQEVRIVSEADREQRDATDLRSKLLDAIKKGREAGEGSTEQEQPLPKTGETAERGPDGKFKAKDGEKAEKPAEAKPETEKPAAEIEKPTPKKPKAEVPGHWPDAVKTKWAELPEDVQEQLAEAGLKDRQTVTKLGQFAKSMEPVARLIEEHGDVFKGRGIDPVRGLSELMQAQKALDTNPVAALQQIAKAYGVKLEDAILNDPQQEPPQMTALRKQLEQQTVQIAQMKQYLQQQERTQYEGQVRTVEQSVSDFAQKNPDFDAVKEDVIALIPALRQKMPDASHTELLQAAYDAAVWTNPTTRQQRLDAETKKRTGDSAALAQKARAAGALNVNSHPSSEKATGDLRTMMMQRLREMRAN
jgi:hypothetical protein